MTVVDPGVTRYFMTIPEACQLVIQAGAIGSGAQVMVLDMGEPMSILEMAQRLIRNSGRDIEIVFTGLREGEKMHEVLFSLTDEAEPSAHEQVSAVMVDPVNPDDLAFDVDADASDEDSVRS